MLGRIVSALIGGDNSRRQEHSRGQNNYAPAQEQSQRVHPTPLLSPQAIPVSTYYTGSGWTNTERAFPARDNYATPVGYNNEPTHTSAFGRYNGEYGCVDPCRNYTEIGRIGWQVGALSGALNASSEQYEAALRQWQQRSHEWENERHYYKQQLSWYEQLINTEGGRAIKSEVT